MHALIQGLILGVLTAGVYALMASGQTLIFGIMKVVNLAQGAMVILGAYLSYQLFTSFGIDPLLAIPITTVALFVVGVVVQLAFLRPLQQEDRSELSLLVTFAVALLLEGIMSVTWKTTDRGDQHQLRELELDRVRLPDHAGAAVGVPAVAGRARRAVSAAEPDQVRTRGPGQRAEPGVGAAARRRRPNGCRRSASASARRPRPPPARCTGCSTRSTPVATTT